jgi:WD40 repeat protein
LPLSGIALRRALIQPALKCGYRFEDEALVDEILSHVEKERGALPLMAFAAARLWEKRDRKNGLLTRQAYQQIGGVTGALAQHAEATMDRIGTERHSIVREIFRNLITAQNTRAARDTEEILSIFEDRKSAEEVLRSLIDARLLSSFEAPAQEGEKPRRRIEIIHESLLSVWPRLVRWQTQDADSAQLRDQLHRAAEVWQERGRPHDLLWTGASYKEFEVWRDHYSGGLTAIEKAFSDAMLHQTRNQRRRRRLLLAAIFVVLLGILAVVGGFWRNAVMQAQRAEASKLLALGRTELDQDPTVALAYAIASLERADTQVARRFALQALWKGPPAFIMTDMPVTPTFLNFSSSGKWLTVGGYLGSRLLRQDGSEAIVLTSGFAWTRRPHLSVFSPKSDSIIWSSSPEPNIVKVWSIPQRKVIRDFKLEGSTDLLVRGSQLIMITDLTDKVSSTSPKLLRSRIRTWSFDGSEPKIVADWNWNDITGPGSTNNGILLAFARGRNFDINNDATLLAYGRERNVYVRPFGAITHTGEILVGKHDHNLTAVLFDPAGKHIASADTTGEIRIWSLSQDFKTPRRTIAARGPVWNLFFNSSGSILAVRYENGNHPICLWDMNGPIDADPFILQRGVQPGYIEFDPFDRWVAVCYSESFAIWPLKSIYPYVLHGEGNRGAGVRFTRDGKWLVSVSVSGSIRLWNAKNLQASARDLKTPVSYEIVDADSDPTGKYVAIASYDGAFLISIPDGKTRRMPGRGTGRVSFSPNGRLLAAESGGEIHLWDIESNNFRILNQKKNISGIFSVKFSPDGSLFSGDGNGKVYQWDVEKETTRLVAKGNKPGCSCRAVGNNPHMLICHCIDVGSDVQKIRSELRIIDLQTGNSYPITSHGNRVCDIDVDRSGTILATGDLDGIVRVGPSTGEEPHLILSPQTETCSISIDPEGQWISSSEGSSPVVRLLRMPKGKPLHTLPYDELLKKLRSLTNVRIVADQSSSTGYRIQFERFPGWEKVPEW